MTHNFTIVERLQLTNTIPLIKAWKFEEIPSKRNLLKEVAFTEEELELYEMKTVENEGNVSIQWNQEKAQTKEITLTEGQKNVLKKLFTFLDESEQAVDQLYDLYEKLQDIPTEK